MQGESATVKRSAPAVDPSVAHRASFLAAGAVPCQTCRHEGVFRWRLPAPAGRHGTRNRGRRTEFHNARSWPRHEHGGGMVGPDRGHAMRSRFRPGRCGASRGCPGRDRPGERLGQMPTSLCSASGRLPPTTASPGASADPSYQENAKPGRHRAGEVAETLIVNGVSRALAKGLLIDAHQAQHLHQEATLRHPTRGEPGRANCRNSAAPLSLRSLPTIPSDEPHEGQATTASSR